MNLVSSRSRRGSSPGVPAIILALFFGGAAIMGARSADIVVADAWARMAPDNRNAAVFMTIHNRHAASVSIVDAESPAARVVELHEMAMQGDVMRMRKIERIEIQAGARVEFKPGGLHVMLIDLVKPLGAGESVALTLHLDDRSKLPVSATVRATRTH